MCLFSALRQGEQVGSGCMSLPFTCRQFGLPSHVLMTCTSVGRHIIASFRETCSEYSLRSDFTPNLTGPDPSAERCDSLTQSIYTSGWKLEVIF